MKYLVFILFLCCIFAGKAQSYRLKIVDPVICFDYNQNKLVVIEDSTYRLEISLKTKKVIKKPLKWDGQVSFNELRAEFIPLSEKGSPMYFVDHGGGWLLELRNDSIVRIDQSFHHQNQFGGAFFMHEGQPNIFGGYGLFTTKCILTRYNFEMEQWYLFNEKRPRIIFMQSLFEKKESSFAVLGTKDADESHRNNTAYSFDFNSKKWCVLGTTLFFDTLNKRHNPVVSGNIIMFGNKIYELNLTDGVLLKYQFKTDNDCRKIIKLNNNYVMICVITNHHTRNAYGLLEFYSEKQFKDKFFERSLPLYNPKKKTDSTGILWIVLSACLGLLGVIGVLWFLKVRRLPKFLPTKGGLSDLVEEILIFWLSKQEHCIELSEINDFVNHDDPSPDNLKKRRETVLKQFSVELARLYKFQEKDVFSTQVHPKDKRMKILVLNSNLVNKIKKEN